MAHNLRFFGTLGRHSRLSCAMPFRSNLPLILAATSLGACVAPSTTEPVADPPLETELPSVGSYTTELPDTPGMALLQNLLDEQFANPDRYATTCATIVNDNARTEALPEEVALALIERYPELAPFARCVWKDDAMVVDAITGERAVIYSVRRITCQAKDDCLAWGGWVTANLDAEAWEYRLRRVDGKWLAERTGNGVIS
ncbi:hypothetical protein P7228_14875 [Altererythrobacter arenosus]|uniref:Lipoprotein n=1 Tax=Altererythrobacter arenosus TaxID=3032592 RepID=A0ABY8FT48_9SPHN|nr:hypothetical protein [Altererythrobacter sp. CAU 1644]WFL77255.1 hypothetical protein P7228_14875 [Altererythrobacter sp. CAU 1644]